MKAVHKVGIIVLGVMVSGQVLAGFPVPTASLPVNSPLALLGLVGVIAVVAYRVLRKRK